MTSYSAAPNEICCVPCKQDFVTAVTAIPKRTSVQSEAQLSERRICITAQVTPDTELPLASQERVPPSGFIKAKKEATYMNYYSMKE